MFNSIPVPQQQQQPQQPPLGPGGVKLHAAVHALKTAFADIIDQNNYTNADINDPYVSFALSLYSKYNNDLDFHNIMMFPIQLSPQLDSFSNLNNASFNMHLPGTPYIYPNETPFLFSLFPSFPYLPLGAFTSTLLNEDLRFERLCLVGASLLEYLIKITLYKKEETLTPANIMTTVRSILNTNSLTILCQAYNIDFNYKFIGYPAPPFKLFLAYFGKYYEHYLGEGESKKEWDTLFKWMEQLLGYIEDDKEKEEDHRHKIDARPPADDGNKAVNSSLLHPEVLNKGTTNEEVQREPTLEFLGHERAPKDEFKLQDLIQSVQQDLNQSVCSSVEISYHSDEHPDLKTGMFSCTFAVNGEDFSSASAMNKKLAKSGAALFAAIDERMVKHIKRSYHDYWIKKYTTREKDIKRAFSSDSRFEYVDPDAISSSGYTKSNGTGEAGELPAESPTVSPAPLAVDIEKGKEKEKDKIVLSTAKEKVYAYYNSKYGIVPKYEFSQLGNAKFEARLFLGNKMVSRAVAASKKEAGAKAAMEVIEQNIDAF